MALVLPPSRNCHSQANNINNEESIITKQEELTGDTLIFLNAHLQSDSKMSSHFSMGGHIEQSTPTCINFLLLTGN